MKRVVTAFVLVFALAPALARAAGFAVNEQSARAAGTASAGVARTDDAAAAWLNPAETADGDGWRIGAGLSAMRPALFARGDAWKAGTQPGLATPPHAYASFATGRIAAGASVNVPFGSSVNWDPDWVGRYEATASGIQVVRASAFAAWRLGRVRIAAGPHLDYATLSNARRLDFVDTEGDVQLALSGLGVGGHAAAFVEVNEDWNVGVTWKSRTRVALYGTADFDVPDELSGPAHDQAATSTLKLPDLVTAGAQWRASDRLRVLGDVGVVTWQLYDALVVDFEDDATDDVVKVTGWKSRPFVRVGGEYDLGRNWTLRAGASFDPTPAPTETLGPTSPDGDRLALTAGTSVRLTDRLTLDAYVARIQFLARTSTNPDSLDATYGGHVHVLGVGAQF